MKKQFPALLLALCLLLTVPAYAVSDSTENFTRQQTYTGQFSDLAPGSVFYDNVAALYEYGLSNGKADGTFGLDDSMTVGQIVIFAARIRSLYRTGNAETGPAAYTGTTAAEPCLRYLQAENVLGSELDGQLFQPATRAQVAHVLASVLPETALPAVHDSLVTQAYASRRFVTDVDAYTPYYQDILSLYRKGISAGSDATGSFLPNALITRGAAAAMLTRMVDPALRVTPEWDLSAVSSAEGVSLSDLVEPGTYIASPSTWEEMDESIRYMLANDSSQLILHYPGVAFAKARKLMEETLAVIKVYCEQSYNTVTCSYTTTGEVTLNFSAAGAGNRLEAYRESTMNAAAAVHDAMWESGLINASMTELEKARVYYQWICDNCAYDFRAGDDSISHIPYNLFENGLAVCDGYTGAYNLLLKLEGIACGALANDTHIWTVATLDGVEYHIDTTWGDTGSVISYDYFAMTEDQSRAYHDW